MVCHSMKLIKSKEAGPFGLISRATGRFIQIRIFLRVGMSCLQGLSWEGGSGGTGGNVMREVRHT